MLHGSLGLEQTRMERSVDEHENGQMLRMTHYGNSPYSLSTSCIPNVKVKVCLFVVEALSLRMLHALSRWVAGVQLVHNLLMHRVDGPLCKDEPTIHAK
jgi:hypothetical protein